MVVFDAIPEHGEGEGLAVVHVALARIVTKDTVHHYSNQKETQG